MTKLTAIDTVEEFWRLMATNDFASVSQVLAADFIVEWPQSKERIRGAEKFEQMNSSYPAHGRWLFKINRIVGNQSEVVTDVSITDGVQTPRAISFFSVVDGRISKIVEFWPEDYPAPQNRAHLVESMA